MGPSRTYQESLKWLARLSDNLGMSHPKALVTWDTRSVTVSYKGLWFGTSYTGWGQEEFEKFEEECLHLLEVFT